MRTTNPEISAQAWAASEGLAPRKTLRRSKLEAHRGELQELADAGYTQRQQIAYLLLRHKLKVSPQSLSAWRKRQERNSLTASQTASTQAAPTPKADLGVAAKEPVATKPSAPTADKDKDKEQYLKEVQDLTKSKW